MPIFKFGNERNLEYPTNFDLQSILISYFRTTSLYLKLSVFLSGHYIFIEILKLACILIQSLGCCIRIKSTGQPGVIAYSCQSQLLTQETGKEDGLCPRVHSGAVRHRVEEEEEKRKKGVVYTQNHSNWKAQGEGTLLDNIQRLCEGGKKQ